jgi:hypothetical protein
LLHPFPTERGKKEKENKGILGQAVEAVVKHCWQCQISVLQLLRLS